MLDIFSRKKKFANLVNVTDAIVQYMISQRGKVSRRKFEMILNSIA